MSNDGRNQPCVVCHSKTKVDDASYLYHLLDLHICLKCCGWLGSLSRFWDNHSFGTIEIKKEQS